MDEANLMWQSLLLICNNDSKICDNKKLLSAEDDAESFIQWMWKRSQTPLHDHHYLDNIYL